MTEASTWKQTCIDCESDDLRAVNEGLTLACEECDRSFPAIVGADDAPPTESVKLHGPPGTGKTTQLVRRIEELLRRDYTLDDMTVITYRKEMARDILSKLYERDLIEGETLRKPWQTDARYVGTLHAVCNRLVDIDPPNGLAAEKQEFCRDRFGVQFARGSDETEPTAGELMFSARSWLLENLVDFDAWDKAPQYDQLIETWPHHPTMQKFHDEWEDWKAQRGISDFDDMLRKVYENELAPRTPVVCADEYHDFTPLQAAIVEQWRANADIEIVDGDPLQVVYSYAGADRRFWDRVELDEILLPRSFRVPSNIWSFATSALAPEHTAPSIQPKQADGEVVEVDSVELNSEGAKNDNATAPIDLIDRYGEKTMFLARTRSQARDVAADLREHGVLFSGQEGTGAWNHAPKRLSIYNSLKKLEGVEHEDGGYGLSKFTSPSEGSKSAASVTIETEDLADLLDRVPAEYIRGTKQKRISKVTGKSKRITGEELAEHVTAEFWPTFTKGAESVGDLLQYGGSVAVEKALRRYDEPVSKRDLAQRARVLTIHASKGQEAENVVLYDGITKRVSTGMSRSDQEKQNEARLWYVACTRAAERLVVARGGWPWTYSYLPDVEVEQTDSKGVVADD